MSELVTQLVKTGDILISPPPASQIPVLPSHSSVSSGSKISPTVLLIIVILAVIFFVSGILHLLVRFLVKRPSFYSSVSNPNRQSNSNVNNSRSNANSEALQRQLQQLFRLHDSGLDQPLIDALPVFYYKDIVGLKEPFDCAVCLCEFSEHDKLRLLPLCSHAFHISCIDTWLLSNSTCPLCRDSLLSHGLENQEFSLDYWRELSFGRSINSDYDHGIIHSSHINNGHAFNCGNKPTIMEENASERRVFSVRLGKFKSLNNDESETTKEREREISSSSTVGSSSNSQLDARRCYSLGSYQYVLADSELQVALSEEVSASSGNISKATGSSENPLVDGDVDVEGKKISRRNKGESFSVSKIWLWSKKGKFQGSSDSNNAVNNNGGPHPINVVLPLSTRDYVP